MTAQPFDFHHRYTVAEFAALPEDNSARYELQEGSLVVSARPATLHMRMILSLCKQMDAQLPERLMTVPEPDVDLELPGPVVRVPDVVVVPTATLNEQSMQRASEVLLAVEVISPGSMRTDTKIKPGEYADAGIPNFWLIDPQTPATATVFHLVNGDYEESQRAVGTFTVADPWPLTIDLTNLRGRSADGGQHR